MARDRQRSKRRRQRPSGAEGGGAVPSRDIGLDDASVEGAGIGEGTPAPDPLKGATPDVDQVKLAEAGSGRGPSGDVPDEDSVEYLPAPDAVEGDAKRRTRGDVDPAVAEAQRPTPSKPRGRVLAFLGHCVDELRRVQWPDRRQVGQATAVVLGFVVLAGGYLGLMDAIWKPLVNAIL